MPSPHLSKDGILFDSEKEAAECRRVAAESRKLAEKVWNLTNREFYLEIEQRWLSLAQKFEYHSKKAKRKATPWIHG
jgi:hypothetical protein